MVSIFFCPTRIIFILDPYMGVIETKGCSTHSSGSKIIFSSLNIYNSIILMKNSLFILSV